MSIKQLETKKGIGYLIKASAIGYYDKSLKRCVQELIMGATYAEALKKEKELKLLVKEKIKAEEKNGTTFKKLLDMWKQREVMMLDTDSATLQEYLSTLEIHTKSIFNEPITRLNEGHIEDIYSEMKRYGKSRSRMRAVRSGINRMYEWAYRERIIPRHINCPSKGARIPNELIKKEQPILNRQEILYFLSKARESEHFFYDLWALAFLTGMRSGELYALKWKDVDFDSGLISIHTSYNNKIKIEKTTKSARSRQFPINSELKNHLMQLKIKTQHTDYVVQRNTAWKRGEAARITRGFCKSIGIREINLHATRACWVIQSLEAKIDVPRVMRMGGWQEFKSFQHYLRLSGVDLKGATENLSLIPNEIKESKVLHFINIEQ